jgi:cysteine sulfinate desulfinase/cysteine desulfurase-like protein
MMRDPIHLDFNATTPVHPSVLAVTNTARFLAKQGFMATTLPVDAYGQVDPNRVRE